MIRTPLTLSLLAALVAAPAAWAATPINQTRPLEARGHVEIDNVKGSIQVRTWDKKEVHVGGSLGKGVEKLTIEGDENDLVIKVEYPRRDSGWGRDEKTEPTDLVINVPVLAELEIDSVSATVDVVGVAGESLEIDSVSGDVTVAAAPREAKIEAVSGDLQLTLNTKDVTASTVSGDLRLKGKLNGEMSVGTLAETRQPALSEWMVAKRPEADRKYSRSNRMPPRPEQHVQSIQRCCPYAGAGLLRQSNSSRKK